MSKIKLEPSKTKLAATKMKLERPKKKSTNPLDELEYTGNSEKDSELELDALSSGFRERRKNEQARKLAATDSEYWCALCFPTRELKEEFLKKLSLINLGDKYIDGMKVAERLGVELISEVPAAPKLKSFRGKYKNLIEEV